jgi:hypothetical protein
MEIDGQDIRGAEVKRLPIISAYASRIGLVEAIDGLLDCDMEVSPGKMAHGMILDALSGRSPLFRMEQFFAEQDVEPLLREDARPYVWAGVGSTGGSGDQQGSRYVDHGIPI